MKMKKFTVAQAGCSDRGKVHIKGFVNNQDRFEYAGLCDMNETRVKVAAEYFKISAPLYTERFDIPALRP